MSAPTLTPMQARCVERLLAGQSDRAIATSLGLSPQTVKAHLMAARARLGGEGLGERWWVRAAYELGKAEAEPPTTVESSATEGLS